MHLLKKAKIVLCVVFILIGILVPCFAEDSNVKLVLFKQNPIFWQFFLGIEKNYFKDEGVQITPVEIPNFNQILDALRTNVVDLAVLPSIFVLSENRKNFFLTAFSSVSNGNDGAIWSSRYRTLKELKGKTIAAYKNSKNELLFVFRALETEGITPKDIKLIDIANRFERISAAAKGGIADSAELPRLAYFDAKENYMNNLYDLKDVFNTFPSYVLVGNRNWIQRNKDLIERFLMGQIKSHWFLNFNINESANILEKVNIGFDKKVIYDIVEYKAVNKFTPVTAMINIESLAEGLDYISKYETSTEGLKKQINETVNLSFLEKAKLNLCKKCWRLPSPPPK